MFVLFVVFVSVKVHLFIDTFVHSPPPVDNAEQVCVVWSFTSLVICDEKRTS